MKTEEILDGNRILAEFMGFTPLNKEHTVFSSNDFLYEREQETNWFDRDLKFHTYWDWLMPVVEKIESLGYAVLICYARVVIECCVMSDKTVIYKNDNNSIPKIKNAFLACVEFAKWYKNQSKQIKA